MKTIKEKNIFEDYEIDENKFLLALRKDATFKTDSSIVTGIKTGASIHYKQEFLYRFDNKFIKDNEKLLLELGIIKKKTKNE